MVHHIAAEVEEHRTVAAEVEGHRTAAGEVELQTAAVVEGLHTVAVEQVVLHTVVAVVVVHHTAAVVEVELRRLAVVVVHQSHRSNPRLVEELVQEPVVEASLVVAHHNSKRPNSADVDNCRRRCCCRVNMDHCHGQDLPYAGWNRDHVAAKARHVEYPRGQA